MGGRALPDAGRGARRDRASRAPRIFVLAALLALPAHAGAQGTPQAELRADAIVARATALQLGAGFNVPVGTYVRAGLVAAGGVTRFPGGDTRESARVDAVARFLLDPFREYRWGPYAAAGGSALYDGDGDWRGALVLIFGVEGSAAGNVRTAFELGLGGGTRIGVVIRRGGGNRR